jgi:phosphatidylserine synthase
MTSNLKNFWRSLNVFFAVASAFIYGITFWSDVNFKKVRSRNFPLLVNILLFLLALAAFILMAYGSYRRQRD